MSNIYYILADNSVCSVSDMEFAYHITHGKYRYKDEGSYIRFIDNLFKRGVIVEYKKLSVQDLVVMGKKPYAIIQYRKDNKYSLMDAKKYVDELETVLNLNRDIEYDVK